MKNLVFVTGNDHKAKYFSKMVGIDVERINIDLDEVQSLDLKEVVEHKVKQAYKELSRPVIVEDTKLVFNALGRLPGPFIKYFLDELGPDGLCEMLNNYSDRSAVAGAAIAYYDGQTLRVFEKELSGKISNSPGGDMGFGWDSIFIPEDSKFIRGDMDEDTYRESYNNTKPFKEIAKFLKSIN